VPYSVNFSFGSIIDKQSKENSNDVR
jgi:hypothetical protein